jgi:hypothetical protein
MAIYLRFQDEKSHQSDPMQSKGAEASVQNPARTSELLLSGGGWFPCALLPPRRQ